MATKDTVIILLSAALVLSLAGCIFLVIRMIDWGITQTYQEAGHEHELHQYKKTTQHLASLLTEEWRGLNREEVYTRLEREALRTPDTFTLFCEETAENYDDAFCDKAEESRKAIQAGYPGNTWLVLEEIEFKFGGDGKLRSITISGAETHPESGIN